MIDKKEFQDQKIVCVDCHCAFVFTPGEQAYYQSRLLSHPRRCPACRKKRRLSIVPDSETRR
ncbi:MAG: zinc-ribbon domain containing protein [Chloroflexi bacterium]|nr:zinc-ribbon domain containing protein [Chloroflexota bacterium]